MSTKKKEIVKPVKKMVVKKAVAKSVASKRRATPAPATKPVHGKTVTHHRVVLYETCTNCAHMPDRVGALVGTLSILVAILSGMVVALAPLPQNWQNLLTSNYSTGIEQIVAQT